MTISISMALAHLMEVAAEKGHENPYNIISAVGEFEVENRMYQIQLQFVIDQKAWIGENDVRFSEIVKMHTS